MSTYSRAGVLGAIAGCAPINPYPPNMVAWWDFNDPNGNGIKPSDLSLLTTIVDKSGNGNNLIQSNTNYQAQFKLNSSLNPPLSSLAFGYNGTGFNFYTAVNAPTLNLSTNTFVMFVVFRPTNQVPPPNLPEGFLIGKGPTFGGGFPINDYSMYITSGTFSFITGNNASNFISGNRSISNHNNYLFSINYSLINYTQAYWQSGNFNTSNDIVIGNNNSSPLCIGNYPDHSFPSFNTIGEFGEIVIADFGANYAYMNMMNDYLKLKWGF